MTPEEKAEYGAKLRDAARECGIPEYMQGGLERYIIHHISGGDFLDAVLKNDLRRACEHADYENRLCLYSYITFLYNHAPSGSWGSPAKVNEWVKGAE